MTTPMSIVIVGAGYMGSAIARGLKRSVANISITLVETDPGRTIEMTNEKFIASEHLPNPITSDALILAIPPQAFLAFSESNPHIEKYTGAIISVMAGISIAALTARFNQPQIYRAIPNLPCAINEGTTVLISAPNPTLKHKATVTDLFSKLGTLLFVDEERLIDNATALVGGGPAYISYFASALIDYAIAAGFDKASATAMTTQTLIGTSLLLKSTQVTPMELCENVMTAGGTTQRAINLFNKKQIRTNIIDGLKKSCARSIELGRRS